MRKVAGFDSYGIVILEPKNYIGQNSLNAFPLIQDGFIMKFRGSDDIRLVLDTMSNFECILMRDKPGDNIKSQFYKINDEIRYL